MSLPPLLTLSSEAEYREYYVREYCKGSVITFDGIRVYFSEDRFPHAFYESSRRDGNKDVFSAVRAGRMGWIKATLTAPDALIFEGWDRQRKQYDASHRVCVCYEDFVVIMRLSLKRDGTLNGNFRTCYQADNSIDKIKGSPAWIRENCLRILGGR